MYCTNCGKKINDTNKYCSSCGSLNKYYIEPYNNQSHKIISHKRDRQEKIISGQDTKQRSDELKGDIKHEINIDNTANKNTSYFKKHWQGKLSLAVSYWVNNILVSFVLLALVTIITETINFTDNPISPSLLMILIWLIILIVTPWIYIGLWRSAANHIKIYNKQFWARVVQVLIVFGWLQSIAIFINQGIPQIIEYSKIALNKDDIYDYKIKVLNDGKELEISGGIDFGLTNEIKQYFNQYPNIKILHLNSLGGRVAEAQKLSRFLENKSITTYSSKGCYSACVDIFMAGEYRVLNQKAQLGFHEPSFPGVTSTDMYPEIEKQKSLYRRKGVDNNFLEKAFSTPHDDLWKPSSYELAEAGVIHKIVDGYNFAVTDLHVISDIKKLESSFLDIPVYQAIKTYEPEEFRKIMEIMETSIKNGDTRNNMYAKGRVVLQKVYLKYLPYASDKLMSDFLDLATEQTKNIYKVDPVEAYNLAMGVPTSFNFMKYSTEEIKYKELTLMKDAIISGKLNPQKLPSQEETEAIQLKVIIPLMEEFGDDVYLFNEKDLADSKKITAAKMIIRMYEIIAALDYEEKIKYTRFFLTQI